MYFLRYHQFSLFLNDINVTCVSLEEVTLSMKKKNFLTPLIHKFPAHQRKRYPATPSNSSQSFPAMFSFIVIPLSFSVFLAVVFQYASGLKFCVHSTLLHPSQYFNQNIIVFYHFTLLTKLCG